MNLFKLSMLIIILSTIINCKDNCNLNKEVRLKNDSIISKYKIELRDYVKIFDEDDLRNNNYEAYRVFIDGSFGTTIIYKVTKVQDSYMLIIKKHIEANSFEPNSKDSLELIIKKNISKKEWNSIVDYANEINYWSLPVKGKIKFVKDGTIWVFEGKLLTPNKCTKRSYHIVSRLSPNDSTKFKKLCKKILDLK